MMELKEEIALSNAYRPVRDAVAAKVLASPDLFPELFQLALDTTWEHHFKACWVMDLVLEANMTLLSEREAIFCDSLKKFTNESALRSISRIVWLALKEESRSKQKRFTRQEKEILATACFDWLVSEVKVAAKSNAIYSLFALGREIDWIYEDLIPVLEKDYAHQSPAYRAAARNTLKRLKR